MTSMAVTASICASTSEAALLLASFMQFSLDLGMIHHDLRRPDDAFDVYSEHPTTSIRWIESPLRRISTVSGSNSNAAAFWLACSRFMRSRWNFESDFRARSRTSNVARGCSGIVGWIVFRIEPAISIK
jgi:hypothetical protein